jgi:hypothetical protein
MTVHSSSAASFSPFFHRNFIIGKPGRCVLPFVICLKNYWLVKRAAPPTTLVSDVLSSYPLSPLELVFAPEGLANALTS